MHVEQEAARADVVSSVHQTRSDRMQQRAGTGFLQQLQKLLRDCVKEAVMHAVKNWAQKIAQANAIAQLLSNQLDQQKTVCMHATVWYMLSKLVRCRG